MPPDTDPIATVTAALARNDRDAARSALGPLIRAAPAVRDVAHHLALGTAAEELGEWRWAETAYNLVLREDPAHPEALARLAALAEERGDLERAAIQRERLAEARPEDRGNLLALVGLYRSLAWPDQARRVEAALAALGVRLEAEEPAAPPPAGAGEDAAAAGGPDVAAVANPTDADVARFLALFGGREDVHARQWYSPRKGVAGYSPVEEPLTARHVRQHLFGDITLGVYPIRLDGTCVFFALDLDLTKAALEFARRGPEEARQVRRSLTESLSRTVERVRELGLQPLVEDSGYKGRHLWFFLERPESARLLHDIGRLLVRWLARDLPGGVALEFFPRQPRRRGKGLGNLIKLPLGIHRRTGRRAWILQDDGSPHPRPFEALAAAVRVSHRKLLEVADVLAAELGERSPGEPAAPWEEVAEEASGGGVEAPAPETGVAPVQPPPWTEADFDRHPHVSAVLRGCAVLDALRHLALETRVLAHDQQIVLVHTLGHLPGGVAAVNYLLERCPGVPADRYLKSPLRGHPISCPKIRQRVPEITSRVACACTFDLGEGAYPTPVLHARGIPAEASPEPDTPDPENLARRFLALGDRLERLRRERAELEAALAAALRTGGGEVVLEEGTLRLVTEDGVTRLEWLPREEAT